MYKRIISFLVLVLTALTSLQAQGYGTPHDQQWRYHNAPDGYYFKRMDIDITVHKNRSYDVVEHLHAFFFEPSHGLYRSIPIGFWSKRDNSEAQDGSSTIMRYTKTDLDNLVVSEDWSVETLEGVKDIRIGSADVWVEEDHSYRISYTLQLSDDRIPVGDLFFHSVLGTGWNCATEHLSFAIHFDEGVPSSSLEAIKVFMGDQGNETNYAQSVLTHTDANLIEGQAFGFGPYQALTVALPLPEGYFDADAPSIWYYLSWALVVLIVCLLIFLLNQEIQGPGKVASVVTFRAPKGMTSADVGSLVDASVDDVDLISLIPWMAAEGCITIENTNKGVVLHNKRRPDNMPDYMEALYDGFFESSGTFAVNSADKNTKFGKAWNKAMTALKRRYKDRLDDEDHYILYIWALGFLYALLICWARATPDAWFNGATTHVALIIITLAFMGRKSLNLSMKSASQFMGCLFKGGCATFGLSCMFGLLYQGINDEADYYLPMSVIYVLLAGVLVVLFFYGRLARMSTYRKQHLGEVLGLKEFIRTAEKSRLEMLLKDDERYFYRILPYAMVFGMVDEWAEKFEGLAVPPVAEFANADVSHVSSVIRPHHFRSHFTSASQAANAAAAAAAAAASSASRSHSSSGGSYHSSSSHSSRGYSGGGSGGGGGRRW